MTRGLIVTAGLAGIAYASVAFAAGFALGVLRILVLAPRVGEEAAVLIELPVILTVSWIICRRLIALMRVSHKSAARAIMGLSALTALLAAEAVLGVLAFDRPLFDLVTRDRSTAELLGLAGQLLYATFPWVQGAWAQKQRGYQHRSDAGSP